MDLGFSLSDKSNDTYPQHHEKVFILVKDIVMIIAIIAAYLL